MKKWALRIGCSFWILGCIWLGSYVLHLLPVFHWATNPFIVTMCVMMALGAIPIIETL